MRQLRGGIRRRQSINTAMSSGLPATPPMLTATSYTLLSGRRTTASKYSNRCEDVSPQHVDSEAYGINEAGQVVGVSCAANQNDCRAVIWDHGVYPTDLNDPDVKGSYSGFLAIAKDINNKGEITGRGVDHYGLVNRVFGSPSGQQLRWDQSL